MADYTQTETTKHRERFWAYVDKTGGPAACWPWTRHCNHSGYGKFHIGGKLRLAHRVAFCLTIGHDLASEDFVLHSCDNPPCCNPAHLRIGNHADNMADRAARGRNVYHRRPSAHYPSY